MKNTLFVLLALGGLLSGGFLLLEETDASAPPNEIVEEWVNANLVRIRINERWEEIPLIPLADHLCRSNNQLFRRHCADSVVAPTSR